MGSHHAMPSPLLNPSQSQSQIYFIWSMLQSINRPQKVVRKDVSSKGTTYIFLQPIKNNGLGCGHRPLTREQGSRSSWLRPSRVERGGHRRMNREDGLKTMAVISPKQSQVWCYPVLFHFILTFDWSLKEMN